MKLLSAERWSIFLQRSVAAPSPELAPCAARGRRILITGAGGSIGAALARALAWAPHASLVLLDHSEQAIFELRSEFAEAQHLSLVLGDAGDPALLRELFRDANTCPELVLHTAAYKHVPLLQEQPFAAVSNNVLATAALLRASGEAQFVLVSTDKAADPQSVMGATKRVAELLTLEAGGTAVRLANVLGSHGSVLPQWSAQLAAGTPLTVTSSTATRYWMTPDEATAALLSAVCNRRSGLFVPPVGEPRPVLALARFLAGEAGSPEHPIAFSGLRPGDKEHEQLLAADESWAAAQSEGRPREVTTPRVDPSAAVQQLAIATQVGDKQALAAALRELCPRYDPTP